MKKYIDRFWKKVNKTPSCWEWQGAKNQQGHGMFGVNGKSMPAHRFSALINGFDITNKLVCHTCDNPKCVNPDHFFLGTHQDNVDDMILKGRNKTRDKRLMTPAGSFNSRLEAAKYYNVSPPAIGKRIKLNPTQYYYY